MGCRRLPFGAQFLDSFPFVGFDLYVDEYEGKSCVANVEANSRLVLVDYLTSCLFVEAGILGLTVIILILPRELRQVAGGFEVLMSCSLHG